MREQIADLISAAFDRMNQHSSQVVDDLIGNAADCTRDGGLALPKRLCNRKTKALLDRFLNNEGRSALQGIDLERAPGRQVEDDNVGVVAGGLLHFFKYECAFGIVAGSAAGQYQLAVNVSSGQLESLYHAHRVLQPVET